MSNPFEALELRLSNIESLLRDLKKSSNGQVQPTPDDEWLDLEQLRKFLPDHPSATTIYKWTRCREIPFSKASKKLLFRKSEIVAWMESGRRKTGSEIKRGSSLGK